MTSVRNIVNNPWKFLISTSGFLFLSPDPPVNVVYLCLLTKCGVWRDIIDRICFIYFNFLGVVYWFSFSSMLFCKLSDVISSLSKSQSTIRLSGRIIRPDSTYRISGGIASQKAGYPVSGSPAKSLSGVSLVITLNYTNQNNI